MLGRRVKTIAAEFFAKKYKMEYLNLQMKLHISWERGLLQTYFFSENDHRTLNLINKEEIGKYMIRFPLGEVRSNYGSPTLLRFSADFCKNLIHNAE
jgi:hypothetical protein